MVAVSALNVAKAAPSRASAVSAQNARPEVNAPSAVKTVVKAAVKAAVSVARVAADAVVNARHVRTTPVSNPSRKFA